MTQAPLTLRRWKRTEYERLVGLGIFEGEPIELIGGQLVVAEPQHPYHTSSLNAVEYAIRASLPFGWLVRTQSPVSLDEESEPEPDLVVVPGRPSDYRAAHPSAAPVLVIEVAESSLTFDRLQKGSLYARAGVHDYWIVNLVDRLLEVYRDAIADASAPYGWRYRSMTSLGRADVAVPLAFTSSRIAVADLLA